MWHFNVWKIPLSNFHLFVYHYQHVKQMILTIGTSYDLVEDLLNEQSRNEWSHPLIQ